MNNKILIIAGFSASGKDTMAKWASEEGYNFVTSTTTRPMRPGESEGNPYYFTNNEIFLKAMENNEFIEVREYTTLVDGKSDTWFYGVLKSEIEECDPYVVVLDILGTKDFLKEYGDRCAVVFVISDDEQRKKRCIERGDYDETEFNRRLEDDRKRFPEDVVDEVADYYVGNTRSLGEFMLECNMIFEMVSNE